MSRHSSLMNRATGLALTSEVRWRHGSVIAKGSKVVAYAVNSKRNSPELDHDNATWHAEESAIRALHRETGRTYGQGTYKGYSIYVARVNTKNEPSMSRPCNECWNLLIYSGITDVYYTNSMGMISYEQVM